MLYDHLSFFFIIIFVIEISGAHWKLISSDDTLKINEWSVKSRVLVELYPESALLLLEPAQQRIRKKYFKDFRFSGGISVFSL